MTSTGRGSNNDGMKKSEMTVTMPLISFNEYEAVKNKYESLSKKLASCFSQTINGSDQLVDFDAKTALSICKEYMPYKYEKADIAIKA